MLLALLAGSQGRWVPAGVLAEALWPDAPPGAATSRLHVHVHRLRSRIQPACIEAGPDGYRLHLHPEAVDARQFDRLTPSVLTAHADGTAEVTLRAPVGGDAASRAGGPDPSGGHPIGW